MDNIIKKICKFLQEYLGKAKDYLRPFVSMLVVLFMSLSGGVVPALLNLDLLKYQPQDTNVQIVSETNESVNIAKFTVKGDYDDSDFIIMSASDLHLEGNTRLDNMTIDALYAQIIEHQPDLIIFTGDIITSWRTEETANEFCKFMDRIGIFWAYTLGEHDAESNASITRKGLAELMSSYGTCITKVGSDSLPGYGNCVINIMESETRVKQSIFLFDTGSTPDVFDEKIYGVTAAENSAGFLKAEHVNWLKSKHTSIQGSYGYTQVLVFMHTPIAEYNELFDEGSLRYGARREMMSLPTYKSGLLDALDEVYNVNAVYFGHSHRNDFCTQERGIFFVANQTLGYNGDQISSDLSVPDSQWIQGVTLTAIDEYGDVSITQSYNREIK